MWLAIVPDEHRTNYRITSEPPLQTCSYRAPRSLASGKQWSRKCEVKSYNSSKQFAVVQTSLNLQQPSSLRKMKWSLQGRAVTGGKFGLSRLQSAYKTFCAGPWGWRVWKVINILIGVIIAFNAMLMGRRAWQCHQETTGVSRCSSDSTCWGWGEPGSTSRAASRELCGHLLPLHCSLLSSSPL